MREGWLTVDTVVYGESAGGTIWLVGARGIVAGLVILALAVQTGAPAVALVAALFVALALVARGWSRLALGGLRCTVGFGGDRAFPDDELDLVLTIENRWPVPVPWLEAELAIPPRLYPLDGRVGRLAESDRRVIRVLATLLPFRRLSWRHRLRCRHRGLYEIPAVSLLVADPLRLFPRRKAFPVGARLIVYPRIVPLDEVGLRSGLPQGDLTLRSLPVDDPQRVIGVRDYRPGDPPRRVHWKASARRPNLQVKLLERTARLQLALYLGVDGFDHPWVVYRDALFERAVTAAASLANWAIERGGRVALGLSGAEPTVLPAGGGPDQLKAILETLAVVTPRRGRPLASVLAASSPRQPAGATIVALVAGLPDDLAEELRVTRARGHPVVLLTATLEPVEAPPGVALYELGRDNRLAEVLSAPC
jgi:uncharacterized protein (DUF58 family)